MRYSVPHRLVRDLVDVAVEDSIVRIFHGGELVASHDRSREPYARIVDRDHYAGLWRTPVVTQSAVEVEESPLAAMGRSLDDYAAVIEGAVA